MSVTTPVLMMSPYVSRTSRLQLFSTDGGIDTGGTSVNAILDTHPVFTGIDITDGNTGVVTTGTLNTPDTAGVGNGTLIGTDGTNAAIAEWDANTEFYPGSSVAAGKRMYLAGTGTYTYNEIGTKIFLNVIQYIVSGSVPQPCVAVTVPYNIAIATNNVDNEAGYIAALEAAGHTVEAVSAKYENLNAEGVATLNGFDLVIISRNNNSGAYGTDVDVRANWMSVTTPVLMMSPYVSRTSRLQLFSTDGGIDTGGTSVNAILDTHPVFTGIDITDGNTGVVTTGTLNTPDTAGVGNGTLIGTDGTNAAIAEWDANTEFYPGSSVAAGKRMYLAGTGTYTYNEIGTKIFLNVIQYLGAGN